MKAPDISDSAPVSAVMRFQLHDEMSFCPGSLGDRKHLDRDPGGAGFVRDQSRGKQQANRSWRMNVSSSVWTPTLSTIPYTKT